MLYLLSPITNSELSTFSCFVEVCNNKETDLQMGKREQVAVVSKARICVGCRWSSSRGCHSECEVGFRESYGVPTHTAVNQEHSWRACSHYSTLSGICGLSSVEVLDED